AGVVRPTGPVHSARSRAVRVAVVLGTVLVLGPATFFGIRALMKPNDGHALVPSATTTTIVPDRSSAAGSPASVQPTTVLLPVSAAPTAASAPAAQPTFTARPGVGRPSQAR